MVRNKLIVESERIFHGSGIPEIGLMINRDYPNSEFTPLRGIIVSLDGEVRISFRSDGGSILVKPIEQIIRDGTELPGYCDGWTRVDTSLRGSWAWACASNRGRIDSWGRRARLPQRILEKLMLWLVLRWK